MARVRLELEGVGLCAREAQQQQAGQGERARRREGRRGAAGGRMLRLDGTFSDATQAEKIIAVYAVDKCASVSVDGQVLDLPPCTLAWRHFPARTRLQVTAGHALWMEITP